MTTKTLLTATAADIINDPVAFERHLETAIRAPGGLLTNDIFRAFTNIQQATPESMRVFACTYLGISSRADMRAWIQNYKRTINAFSLVQKGYKKQMRQRGGSGSANSRLDRNRHVISTLLLMRRQLKLVRLEPIPAELQMAS